MTAKFSPAHYSRLKSRLKTKYQTKLKSVLGELKKYKNTHSHEWVMNHQSELKEYSPLKWFYLKQLSALTYFHKHQRALPETSEDFSPAEDELFEKWNASEFADVFLKALNKGASIKKASVKTSEVFDEHLVALSERHFIRSDAQDKNYRIQTSLGDVAKGRKVSRLLETTLHLEGKELKLMTSTMDEMKTFSHRIEVALKIIKKHSPTSWERFNAFTEVIIPIKQEEFVSYSHQELPGTSMINMYDRDFVDLMDDLLHENGHHHLNYYLNLGKVIDEPIDNIYYSPWRRTLRPLRGIYHAYFTFFWAFKLFSDLANAKDMDSIWYVFKAEEKEKVYWRAVEEFYMLNYTFNDLKWARKQGLINDLGWELVSEQQKILKKFKKKIPFWEKKLRKHKKELSELKKTLKKAERDFKF